MTPCRSLAALHSARPQRCLSALLRLDIAVEWALLRSFRRHQPPPVGTSAFRPCCFPALPGTTFEMGTPIPIRVPPAWFFTTSADYSSSTSRPLQVAADPGVHHVSFCRETEFPAMHLLPFEAFPPPTATATETNPGVRGRASPCWPLPTLTFTANLALSPFLFRSPPRQETAASFQQKSRPQGLAPSSGPLRLGRFQPLAPGAPLGLSDSPAPLIPSRRHPSADGGSRVSETRLLMNRRYVEDTPKSALSA